MTLIVSLRTPDGIVIAGDSLSTMLANRQAEADFNVECSKCHSLETFKGKIPNIYKSNTLSHAQKIFPFMGKFGVGTYGGGQFLGKTIHFAIRELEEKLLHNGGVKKIKTISDVSQEIGRHLQNLIAQQIKQESHDEGAVIPEGYYPVGFQIVGYENDLPITLNMDVGKNLEIMRYDQLGISYNGQIDVVNTLFSRFNTNPEEQPVFQLFSLQDAIIYSEFLIKTTSIYQRFSSNMATVGGEIDIALVTPFDGFRWVKQKSLQAKLSGEIHE